MTPWMAGQPISEATPQPSRVATAIWPMAPGMAIALTAIRSFSEVQADAEHQQHHAQFGQLVGQRLVGDEAGVNGPTQMPATR